MSNYSKEVMKRFKKPKFAKEMNDADAVGEVGNPTCVTKDTLIFSNPEIKKITELEKNKFILSHDGEFHNITKKFIRNYKGNIYTLDIWNLGMIQITPEHNIFALKTDRYRDKFRFHKKYIPDWFAVQELKKGDYTLYPIPKEVVDKDFIKFDIPKPKYDFRSRNLPSKIKVDNAFLKIVGFFLAEGYTCTKKCNGTVGFCFGSHEEGYVKEVIKLMKKVFRLNYSRIERRTSHSIVIIYYSARLARFFSEQFGKGVINKHVPHWMLLLPTNKQELILSGLWQGDGYVNGRTAKFVTISKQLAYQTFFLLLRQRILFSFLTSPQKGMHKEHFSTYIKEQASLRKIAKLMKKEVEFPKIIESKHKSWYSGDYLYTPIRDIISNKFSGEVYNLEVGKSHSYVSSCATLHNCGDVMKVFIKIGKNKKGEEFIKDISFQTFGCVAAISSSDALCELAKGKTVKEALKITRDDIVKKLHGLPSIKFHCSVLGEEALQKAIENYRNKVGSIKSR